MKLGKRRYSMNSIAVARGCSCYTVQQREFRQNQRRGAVMETPPFLYINLTV